MTKSESFVTQLSRTVLHGAICCKVPAFILHSNCNQIFCILQEPLCGNLYQNDVKLSFVWGGVSCCVVGAGKRLSGVLHRILNLNIIVQQCLCYPSISWAWQGSSRRGWGNCFLWACWGNRLILLWVAISCSNLVLWKPYAVPKHFHVS